MTDFSFLDHSVDVVLEHTRNMNASSITYTRGATTLTISKASQGQSVKRSIDVGGEEQVVETQEWMVGVSDLASLAPPQSGDLIARTINGTTHTFTVECLDMGESPWDFTDNGRTEYRIQTRKDGASAFEVSEPTGFDLQGNELRYD